MMNHHKRCHNKFGSVLIVVISIFAVLAIFFASFLRSSTSRTHSTKKLGDAMLARELANSLAVASFHNIKNVELKNEGSSLRKILSEPIPDDSGSYTGIESGDLFVGVKSNIKEGTENIIDVLLKNSGLDSVKIDELSWKIQRKDFARLKVNSANSPFPREKKGIIRVYIKLSYRLPGQKHSISEDYLFASTVTVTANLLPILSKFTFYVKDVFDNDRPSGKELRSKFNLVQTYATGELKSSKYIPWVFLNGDDDNLYKNYGDFVTGKKGLIYLGGGTDQEPVLLGIARGFSGNTSKTYGEDFHFYKAAKGGYWKTYEVWSNGDGILAANIGLCDEGSNKDDSANLRAWQGIFGEGYKSIISKNSIFRLFGTDSKGESPTLVLGYVNSMIGEARAYKGSQGTCQLPYFDYLEDFANFSTLKFDDSMITTLDYGEDYQKFGPFATAYAAKTNMGNSDSEIENFYEEYKEKYSARVVERRYNQDYAYYLAKKEPGIDNDARAYPLEFGSELVDKDLKELCLKKTNTLFTKPPLNEELRKKYLKVFSSVDDLGNLEEFLKADTLYIDGSEDSAKSDRLAHKIKYFEDKNQTLDDYFRLNSMLKKDSSGKEKFDPNGWIYVDSENGSVELKGYDSISQGGFVVSGGVTIKGDLKGEHLTIIALNGDISIQGSVTTINASLIAPNGELKLEEGNELTLTGNIVMKHLSKSNIANGFRRKFICKYNENLSALPFKEDKNLKESDLKRTEFPMLMFDLKDRIVMID